MWPTIQYWLIKQNHFFCSRHNGRTVIQFVDMWRVKTTELMCFYKQNADKQMNGYLTADTSYSVADMATAKRCNLTGRATAFRSDVKLNTFSLEDETVAFVIFVCNFCFIIARMM